jgi:oligopeptide/dipeptide ABC transporter ATP-binding protein
MSTGSTLISARDLEVDYKTRDGSVRSLDSATLTVRAGEITALVGESGSGKSTLGMAAGGLLASNAMHAGGRLEVAGISVFDCDAKSLARLRRDVLGFIFQNPVAALDPTQRIGRQMELAARGFEPGETVAEALEQVQLDDVPRVLRSYPHQLSGGMAQRVGIAMALRRRPRLLIADEPTAAIDATLRERILELLVARCRAAGCALLLLTHDMHAVSEHSSHIAVMYGGRIVEYGETGETLESPQHPYTRALLTALPGEEGHGQRLHAIPGVPPVLRGPCAGCAFAPRCPDSFDRCLDVRPVYTVGRDRNVCCHLVSETPRAADGQAQSAEADEASPTGQVVP